MRIWTSAAAAGLLALPACAQSPPTPPAPPACTDAAYRQFDFWLGSWTVHDASGAKAGDNLVTSEEGGCLIVERWRAVSGNTGRSYNFYDPGTMQWRQVWVSRDNVIDYAGGLNAKGEMELRGQIRYRDGRSAPFLGVWTKQADGSVRQHFEEFDREKMEWVDWFTGTYRRKPA